MDDNIGCFTFVLILALCMIASYWLYTTVIGSNLPDWVKYVLLR